MNDDLDYICDDYEDEDFRESDFIVWPLFQILKIHEDKKKVIYADRDGTVIWEIKKNISDCMAKNKDYEIIQ